MSRIVPPEPATGLLNPVIEMVEEPELTSEELAAYRKRSEDHRRNWEWYQTHVLEFGQHRGKHLCIAGQEAFVAETSQEAWAAARTAHPEDGGIFHFYVPERKAIRVDAYQG